MKTIVYQKPNVMLTEDRPYPERKKGEVTIKIHAVGICGSDIHAFKGSQPMFTYPKVVGHEIGAEIVESETFQQGQKVSVVPYYECGKCIACRNGKRNACSNLNVIGVHSDGGFSEYITVPEEKIVPVEGLNYNQIAMIEPLAISEHAFSRAQAKENEKVIVSGVGPIGMGIIIMAKYRGASVIAIDMNQERLNFAKDILGADWILQPSESLSEDIAQITNGEMATKIWDATGHPGSMNNTVNLLANGGSIVFVGLHKENIDMVDIEFHKREATLLASRAAYYEDFKTVIEMIQSGFFNPENLITSIFTFDEFPNKFEDFTQDGSQIKGIVTF